MKDAAYWLVQVAFGASLIGLVYLISPAEVSRSVVALASIGWFVGTFLHWLKYGPTLRPFFGGTPPLYKWLKARRAR